MIDFQGDRLFAGSPFLCGRRAFLHRLLRTTFVDLLLEPAEIDDHIWADCTGSRESSPARGRELQQISRKYRACTFGPDSGSSLTIEYTMGLHGRRERDFSG